MHRIHSFWMQEKTDNPPGITTLPHNFWEKEVSKQKVLQSSGKIFYVSLWNGSFPLPSAHLTPTIPRKRSQVGEGYVCVCFLLPVAFHSSDHLCHGDTPALLCWNNTHCRYVDVLAASFPFSTQTYTEILWLLSLLFYLTLFLSSNTRA